MEVVLCLFILGTIRLKELVIEETYNANGELTNAVLYGHAKVRGSLFRDCSNFISVDIPSGATSIGAWTFWVDRYSFLYVQWM